MAKGGQEMLDDMYKGNISIHYNGHMVFFNKCLNYLIFIDHILPANEFIPDYDITLGIDMSQFPKTQSKYKVALSNS